MLALLKPDKKGLPQTVISRGVCVGLEDSMSAERVILKTHGGVGEQRGFQNKAKNSRVEEAS